MEALDRKILEELLYDGESRTLDFKADQYLLTKEQGTPTDFTKSKLVKDILAFANTRREGTAYILIGVKDTKTGGRSEVVGIAHPLDDTNFQALMKDRTNVPVLFDYTVVEMDGKTIGVVRVAKEQRFPVFVLKADFGDVRRNVVYYRRGSTNEEMTPDEIAARLRGDAETTKRPTLLVEVGDPRTRQGAKERSVKSVVLMRRTPRGPTVAEAEAGIVPPPEVFAVDPDGGDKVGGDPVETNRLSGFARMMQQSAELETTLREEGFLKPVSFVVTNRGPAGLKNARLVAEVPLQAGVVLRARGPRPATGVERAAEDGRRAAQRLSGAIHTSVRRLPAFWQIEVQLGDLPPHHDCWTPPIWVGAESAVRLPVSVRIVDEALSPEHRDEVLITVESTGAALEDALEAWRAENKPSTGRNP